MIHLREEKIMVYYHRNTTQWIAAMQVFRVRRPRVANALCVPLSRGEMAKPKSKIVALDQNRAFEADRSTEHQGDMVREKDQESHLTDLRLG